MTLAEIAVAGLLGAPGLGALVLLALPGYRASAILNVLFCTVTLLARRHALFHPATGWRLPAGG